MMITIDQVQSWVFAIFSKKVLLILMMSLPNAVSSETEKDNSKGGNMKLKKVAKSIETYTVKKRCEAVHITHSIHFLPHYQRADMYIKTYFYSRPLRFRHLATGRFRPLGCSYRNLILHICKYFATLAHINMWLHIFGFWNIFCTYFGVSSYIR